MIEAGEADRPFAIGPARPLDPATGALVVDRLRAGTFVPVLAALTEGVATAADIDQGAREALKFATPPCALMRELGPAEVRRIIAPVVARYEMVISHELAGEAS
jgi:3-hydroxyacyl-CoA dehydrogenase